MGVQNTISTIAVEGGADPDDHISGSFSAAYNEMDWLDEDDDDDGIVGILHGGSEHIDKAWKRFEYIVLPRFVFLIVVFTLSAYPYFVFIRHGARHQKIFLNHRRAQLTALHKNWANQMPALVQAYMQWKHRICKESTTVDDGGSVFEVTVIDTFSEFGSVSCLSMV